MPERIGFVGVGRMGSNMARRLKEEGYTVSAVYDVNAPAAMKKIYSSGLLSRAKGKLFINCATVTPDVHVKIEEKVEKAGAQSLEACMASSITQARQGTL